MPEIAIAGIDLFPGSDDRDAVLGSVRDRVFAAPDVPLAPRSDHRKIGSEGGVGELEPHLVVALARAAMRQRVGADLARDLDLTLCNQWPGDCGAEQVLAIVNRPGAEHRPDVVANELLAKILDVTLGRA